MNSAITFSTSLEAMKAKAKITKSLAAINGNAIAATNGSTNGKSMTAPTIATTALMKWTCPVPGAVMATTFT